MNINNLLHRISDINKKYEQFAQITGENFNVFSILGLKSAENAHSLFIADLLNPKGSHSQGELYLKLFLDELGFSEHFEHLNLAKVTTEKHIGDVAADYSEGGRIDIFIEHKENNIIIENKIYAGDQFQQLYRYYQYGNEANKTSKILYLTLDGSEPSKESLGELSIESISCISYREHILNWLELCIAKSSILPVIRETIIQYRNIIKQLTNQCNSKNKETEIMDILLSSEENFNAAKEISVTIKKLIDTPEAIEKILQKKILEKFNQKDNGEIKLFYYGEFTIYISVSYEYKWFHIDIYPLKNNKYKCVHDSSLQTISNKMNSLIEEILTSEHFNINKKYYLSNENYFCWIPFGVGEDEKSYLFHKPSMTYAEYKWLDNPDNQEKLAQYAFNLCNKIIQFLKNNLKDTEVKFLI